MENGLKLIYKWDSELRGYTLSFSEGDYDYVCVDIEFLSRLLNIDEDNLTDICINSGAEFDGFYFTFQSELDIKCCLLNLDPFLIMGELTK